MKKFKNFEIVCNWKNVLIKSKTGGTSRKMLKIETT